MYDLNTVLGNYSFGVDFGESAYKFVAFTILMILLVILIFFALKG